MSILEKLGLKKAASNSGNESTDLESKIIGEIALPDGRIASIHEIKYLHLAISHHENGHIRLANLLSLTIRIDGHPLSVAEIMNMPHPIVDLLLTELQSKNAINKKETNEITNIPEFSNYETDLRSIDKYLIDLRNIQEDVCVRAFIEGRADGAYCLYIKSSGNKKQSMLRCAAALGHPLAQNNLGMQLDSNAYQDSENEIRALINASAKYGIPHAQVSIGWWHMTGKYGFALDYAEAMKWNRLAYAQGHSEGANNIGELYEYGKGMPVDIEFAKSWYHKAAQLGNEEAAERLRKLNNQ